MRDEDKDDKNVEVQNEFGTLSATIDRGIKNENAMERAHISIPTFRNGYKSVQTVKNRKQTVVTANTCGFDSIFAVYTALYFDDELFRKTFRGDSKFIQLVKKFFDLFSSKTGSSSSEEVELYTCRNNLLKELFNQKCVEKDGTTYIDCTTGIGKLFGQISKEMCPLISSGAEIKTCQNQKCKSTETFLKPFIPVVPIDLDLRRMQNYLRLPRQRNRTYFCDDCKGNCTLKIYYNNVVVLEVEPYTVRVQKRISIRRLTETILIENDNFHLFGVVEYNNHYRHFKSHLLRNDGKWVTYDDLQVSEIEIEKSKIDNEGIAPYLLFYKKENFGSNFSEALIKGYMCIS